MNQQKYDIFISYRRKTGVDDARLLQQSLKARGYNVFFDYDSLRDGKFDERIYAAIEEAPIFILILSEGALDNCVYKDDWVRNEIEHALKHKRKIIPIASNTYHSPLSFFRRLLTIVKLMFGHDRKEIQYFPSNLPQTLSPITKEQVSELNKASLFDESVDKIIMNRFPLGLSNKKSNALSRNNPHMKKMSDAFEFGVFVAFYIVSLIRGSESGGIQNKLKEWDMSEASFETSTSNDVITTLNRFIIEFGEKWGEGYSDSFYLGCCWEFGTIHWIKSNGLGEWERKIIVQCVKLNIPDNVTEKISKISTEDELQIMRYKLVNALDLKEIRGD